MEHGQVLYVGESMTGLRERAWPGSESMTGLRERAWPGSTHPHTDICIIYASSAKGA